MGDILNLTDAAPLSLSTLAINLVLTLILSTILSWFYVQYGRSFSNRSKLAEILPVIAVTTALIISVVKSSLALSLGLVGALSIIRFRTAIKEPEELSYLFIAIAIGLGMGADQRFATILAIIIILLFLFLRRLWKAAPAKNNLFLNIVTPHQEAGFSQINDILTRHVASADLHRLDQSEQTLQATYLIETPSSDGLNNLMEELRTTFPQADFSFVEQENSFGG